MDQTPTRASRSRSVDVHILDEGIETRIHSIKSGRIKKPPPITPRRFNKFFTPRPRNLAQTVRTSRHALRTISSSALNSRTSRSIQPNEADQEQYHATNENDGPRKKRKYSSITSSLNSTPQSRTVTFLPSSQDPLPSSPLKYYQKDDEELLDDDSDASTEINEDAWSSDEFESSIPPIRSFSKSGNSRSMLANRITGRRSIQIAETSNLWQQETANFYSGAGDLNMDLHLRQPHIIPFSMTACNTNPLVAVGDEEGFLRFLDPDDNSSDGNGFDRTVLAMQPHDNAIMDLVFSNDDNLIATASGDQTCQIIDVQTQRSLYSLRAHTASVKKIQFQPGSGDKILASAGRDGVICLWDLRAKSQPLGSSRRARMHVTNMAEDASVAMPVLEIHDAHNPNAKSKSAPPKAKGHSIAARNDFSITSLAFLDQSRNNLLATASEVDTVIKLWDLRLSQVSARKKAHSQLPVSVTDEPRSHASHRKFGINSIALSTDRSRIYALSRDHTVYAYATSHLILGSSPEMSASALSNRKTLAPMRTDSEKGIGPLYGLRHPSLRVASFWARLSVRPGSDHHSELLAVGSTDDCAIVFPTSEKYLTASTRTIPALHDPANSISHQSSPTRTRTSRQPTRPSITRVPTTSFTTLFTKSRQEEDALMLPIYYHGTPLIHGHTKEVTSVAWSHSGNLVTASDDFTLRCWREDAAKARRLRGLSTKGQRDEAALLETGWADVGVDGWDDED